VFEMQLHLLPMNSLLYLFSIGTSGKEMSENPEYLLAESRKGTMRALFLDDQYCLRIMYV